MEKKFAAIMPKRGIDEVRQRRNGQWLENYKKEHTTEKEIERHRKKQAEYREKARVMLEDAKKAIQKKGGFSSVVERAMKEKSEQAERNLADWMMKHSGGEPSAQVVQDALKNATEENENGSRMSASEEIQKLKAGGGKKADGGKKKKKSLNQVFVDLGKHMEKELKVLFGGDQGKSGKKKEETATEALQNMFKALQEVQKAGAEDNQGPAGRQMKAKSKPMANGPMKELQDAMAQFPDPGHAAAGSMQSKVVKGIADTLKQDQFQRSRVPGGMGENTPVSDTKGAGDGIIEKIKELASKNVGKILGHELPGAADFKKLAELLPKAKAKAALSLMRFPATEEGPMQLNLQRAEGVSATGQAFFVHDQGATCHQGEFQEVSKLLNAFQSHDGLKNEYAKAVVIPGTCKGKEYTTLLQAKDDECKQKVLTFLDRDITHQRAWMSMEKVHHGAMHTVCGSAFKVSSEGTSGLEEKHFDAAEEAGEAAWRAVHAYAKKVEAQDTQQAKAIQDIVGKAAMAAAKTTWSATLEAERQNKEVDRVLIAQETKNAVRLAAREVAMSKAGAVQEAKVVAQNAQAQKMTASTEQEAKAITKQKAQASTEEQFSNKAAQAVQQMAKTFVEKVAAKQGTKVSSKHHGKLGRWTDKTKGASITAYGHLRHDGSYEGNFFGTYGGLGIHAGFGSMKNKTHRQLRMGGAAGSALGSLARHFSGDFPISGEYFGPAASTAIATANELKVRNSPPVTLTDEVRTFPLGLGEDSFTGHATLAVPDAYVTGKAEGVSSTKTGAVGKLETMVKTPEYKGPFIFNAAFGQPIKDHPEEKRRPSGFLAKVA